MNPTPEQIARYVARVLWRCIRAKWF